MTQATQPAATAAETVLMRLKEDIFSGALPPAAKLKVKDLAERYGIGATPIREALSHLAATGVINQHSQRGFRVPKLDAERCLDLMKTRQVVECEAFRLAVQNGDAAWEDAIVSNYSLLIREIDRVYARKSPTIARYEERHSEFHRALISACPINGLKGFVDDVYLRLGIYRRLTYTEGFPKDYVVKQHRKLMNAALRRDVDAAVAAMTDHISRNSAILRKIISRARESHSEVKSVP
jgi:GntR family transcriptional regulator, carbon starvation induced regulator